MTDFLLSQIKAFGFDDASHLHAAVEAFIAAKKEHLKTEGQPAPTAPHPAVEAAVKRIPGSITFRGGVPDPSTQTPDDFVADYRIIDDTPPPPTVEEKKAAIAAKINAEGRQRLSQIVPPLKAKLLEIQFNDASAAQVAGTMTEAHQAALADYQLRVEKSQKIMRHVAELESQLHDLPDDMIDIWKWPAFPEV